MGERLVSDSAILVPVLINFEGLGASLNARERSRADVYFPLFPFKDNFIKTLCFHSGLNMGHLNGKVIISPRLLMVRGESGKGGMPVREEACSFGLAHACMHMHRPYRQAHTIRLTLSSMSHHTEPLTLAHTVHPQKDTPHPHPPKCRLLSTCKLRASTHLKIHSCTTAIPTGKSSLSYTNTRNTLCSQYRPPHRYPHTPLPSIGGVNACPPQHI